MATVRNQVLAALSTAAVALGLVPVLASPAQACSCVPPVSDAEYAASADVVFVGRVDAIDRSEDPGSSADPAIWRFVVDEVFKGEVAAYTEVVSAVSGASCGLELRRGQTAIVFARFGGDGIVEADDDDLTAHLCNGTREVVADEPDLATPGYAPVAMTMTQPALGEGGDGFPLLGWLSLVAVGGLGAMAGGLWMRLRSGLGRA